MDFGVVIDALTKVVQDIVDFIPRFINGLIILLIGYLVTWVISRLVGAILRRIRFDAIVERTGITGALLGLGIKTPMSTIISQTIFGLLLLSFLITSTRLMGLDAVTRLLEQLLTFVPNVIAAVIVFLLGGIVAQFLGGLVTSVAAGSGLNYAGRIGRVVQYLVSVFVAVIALGVLGMDTQILITALTVTLAAFGLALGLALGLGARNIVYHILAGYYMRQRFPVGQPIAFGEARGEVSGAGGVNIVVTTEQGKVVIPNGMLLESIVQAPEQASPKEPPQE